MATVTPEQMKKALSSLSALEGMASGYCELQDGFDTSKGIAENVRQVLAALAATPAEARTFPIQSERAAKPHPTRIPWWLADLAYSVYRARFGSGQSLERLAERGGFHPSEMDEYVPDWRELAAQAPPASDPPGLSAEATLKSLEIGFCSSNCGPVYRADEDGCCVTCGGDITFHDRSRPLGQTRCTVCRDTALPCQLGHTGRMLGPQPVAQAPHASDPPCQQCGGPHRFDTSVPSEAWNRVIRAAGLPDYLCAACVLAAFVRAGEPLDATLCGDGFTGERVALRVASPPAETEELPCLVENDACARCGKIHEWAGCCAEFPVDPDAWCENCRKRAGRASPAGEGGSVSG